jgi:hypothetical protein
MTVVIHIPGLRTGNPDLPILGPIVQRGLLAAFRPARNLQHCIDLSGNGRRLNVKGLPRFTDAGVIGSSSHGLTTDVLETESLSILAVSRLHLDGTPVQDFSSAMVAGCYVADDVAAEDKKRGTSLMWAVSPGSAGTYNLRTFGQTHGCRIDSGVQENVGSGNVLYTDLAPGSAAATRWEFIAITVDAVANNRIVYVPRINKKYAYPGASMPIPVDFSRRHLSFTKPARYMAIATTTRGANFHNTGRVEVSESLFYGDALSEAEVYEQYTYSQAYLSEHRGVAI